MKDIKKRTSEFRFVDTLKGIEYVDFRKDKRRLVQENIQLDYINGSMECLSLVKDKLPYKKYDLNVFKLIAYAKLDSNLKGIYKYCSGAIIKDNIGVAIKYSSLKHWPTRKVKDHLVKESLITDSFLEAGEAISSRRYEKYSREEFDSVWVHYFHQYKDSLIYLEKF